MKLSLLCLLTFLQLRKRIWLKLAYQYAMNKKGQRNAGGRISK